MDDNKNEQVTTSNLDTDKVVEAIEEFSNFLGGVVLDLKRIKSKKEPSRSVSNNPAYNDLKSLISESYTQSINGRMSSKEVHDYIVSNFGVMNISTTFVGRFLSSEYKHLAFSSGGKNLFKLKLKQ